MKNRIYSSLHAVVMVMACWLLPTLGFASVLVDGVCYELDDAAKTAVVVPGSDENLEFLTIPETITHEGVTYTVTAIADCAFLGRDKLCTVTIDSHSLTYIGYSAFERCYSLSELQFAEGLTKFNYEAFKNCSSLNIVTLPSTLKVIGDYSFMGCTNLKVINVPASVEYIGKQWVSGCPLYLLMAERKVPLSIKASRFEGIDKEKCILCVPNGRVAAYKAADVWKDFLNIREKKEVLEVAYCGDNVIYIIFADRTMLVCGDGDMHDYWLDDDPVSDLGATFVEELTIEEGVTHIGAEAFFEFEKLSTINVPNSLTSIGQYAFDDTPWYNNHPDGEVVYVGNWVYGLKGLEGADVVLREGTVGHAASAFLECNISSLSIPSSMTYIYPTMYEYDDGHFYYPSFGEIGSIVVDAANPILDSRDDCNAIIETASNTLLVGSHNMELPEGITTIGPFALSRVTYAYIPSSVTLVDNFAFCNSCYIHCEYVFDKYFLISTPSAISTVKMGGSNPPAVSINHPSIQKYNFDEEKNHFAGIDGEKLYVPLGCSMAYGYSPWGDFSIIEYDPDQGGTTAIEGVREQDNTTEQIYDLQGRRLNNASGHSIIIENGTKRIMR